MATQEVSSVATPELVRNPEARAVLHSEHHYPPITHYLVPTAPQVSPHVLLVLA